MDKPIVWLHAEVKTPPFSKEGRMEAGYLLRMLQKGESLGMPWSRPMPDIAPRCHELRVADAGKTWRIVYRADDDAIVILEVFGKQTQKTSRHVMDTCSKRLRAYDQAQRG